MSSAQRREQNGLAEKYSQLNDYQMKYEKDLFSRLCIKGGDNLRFLDMGCGTGELTAFIANKLGDNSEVVGIDPILDKINIAMNRHCRKNLTFIHGKRFGKFPHYNEEYYDVHFSNFVFHCLSPKEKKVFIKTAFKVLKPGGRIAIHCLEEEVDIVNAALDLLLKDGIENNKLPFAEFLMNKADVENMLKNACFVIISNAYKPATYPFENTTHFLSWIRATFYIPESNVSASKIAEFAQRMANEDDSVTLTEPKLYQIIAMKPKTQ